MHRIVPYPWGNLLRVVAQQGFLPLLVVNETVPKALITAVTSVLIGVFFY
jgi:hypothetical protein